MRVLAIFVSAVFQDFESFLRTEIDLAEEDIRLVLDEYSSSFIIYEIQPGIHTFEDISEALFNFLQPEYPGPSNIIDIEFDGITRKSKLAVKKGIIAIRFHEKSFFSNTLRFQPH